ncbi:MAG: sulfatase-like hydrolase/transferase, partial [Chloroflexota bacterium]|nr:sulfatase-like hydrolase/transferase [Chloroflexota bacterium]
MTQTAQGAKTTHRPLNILFLWTDQQRPDTIGAYGGGRFGTSGTPSTPHVDRLAGSGALFEHAYCSQPVCSPSRASVLTGLYPHAHGVPHNNIPLPGGVPTLAERLRAAGYACGYIGKWHLGNELGRVTPNGPGRRGFDDCWVSTEDTYTRNRSAEGFSDYHQFLVSRGYEPPDMARDGAKVFSRPSAAQMPEEVGKPAFQAAECPRFLEMYRD